jgi:hypothetical protein
LSLGAGALIGAVLGAAGAWGVARTYNLVRGPDESTIRWTAKFLTSLVLAAIRRYLAVAHFGRGRGNFVESEYPSHWRAVVEKVIAGEDAALSAIWTQAEGDGEFAELRLRLDATLARVLQAVLAELYPGCLSRAARP